MNIWKSLRTHFERRFELGLREVDPVVARFEKNRRHLPRLYNLIWFMITAVFVVLLVYVSRR